MSVNQFRIRISKDFELRVTGGDNVWTPVPDTEANRLEADRLKQLCDGMIGGYMAWDADIAERIKAEHPRAKVLQWMRWRDDVIY